MPIQALVWMLVMAVSAFPPTSTDHVGAVGGLPPTKSAASAAAPARQAATHAAAPQDPLLTRAAEYVAKFEETFSAVTWRERYEQEDRLPRRFNSSGARVMQLTKRQVESQLLFVWLPHETSWIAVRDVMTVDGKAQPDADRPLRKMSAGGGSISVAELKTLAAENGRFNIGKIIRTFNEPTLALLFLDERYRRRFEFERGPEQTLKNGRVRLYRYVERGRPTVIRANDHDLPAKGSLAIEPETGRILWTSLVLVEAGNVQGNLTVTYAPHPDFDVLVPIEMREVYSSIVGEEVTATATYSDFRRFEAHSRLIVPQ